MEKQNELNNICNCDNVIFSSTKLWTYLHFTSFIERFYSAGDCIAKQTDEMIIKLLLTKVVNSNLN